MHRQRTARRVRRPAHPIRRPTPRYAWNRLEAPPHRDRRRLWCRNRHRHRIASNNRGAMAELLVVLKQARTKSVEDGLMIEAQRALARAHSDRICAGSRLITRSAGKAPRTAHQTTTRSGRRTLGHAFLVARLRRSGVRAGVPQTLASDDEDASRVSRPGLRKSRWLLHKSLGRFATPVGIPVGSARQSRQVRQTPSDAKRSTMLPSGSLTCA
jgi:hypothetical protein